MLTCYAHRAGTKLSAERRRALASRNRSCAGCTTSPPLDRAQVPVDRQELLGAPGAKCTRPPTSGVW
ncbi:MAG: hypothetical protein AB7L28_14525, partial [Kofleriaceae bacterium]